MNCVVCGSVFIPKTKRSKCCTAKCNNKRKWDKWKNTDSGKGRHNRRKKYDKVCVLCGCCYKAVDDNSTYCGRKCQLKSIASKGGSAPHPEVNRKYIVYPFKSTVSFKKCLWCGDWFGSRSGGKYYCHPNCSNCAVAASMRSKYRCSVGFSRSPNCIVCGVDLPVEKTADYCSAKCMVKTDSYKVRRKAVRQLRRARMANNGRHEIVKSILVFERDNFICQLCYHKVDMAMSGTTSPKAPELDHIIPLSKGGEHTYANTQCSCRECNGNKGDKIMT